MSRIPLGTYRLQLFKDFTLDDASAIADYLKQLGVSHVYCSPYLQAAPGSAHGYDVVDHHHVNEELGGQEAHDRFCATLGEVQLGQVLDIVPNHMAIAGEHNRYWWDVLENGPSSRYGTFFDIDWASSEEKLHNKVLVPLLGDHYGRVLARNEIQVKRKEGNFFINYFDNELPVAPRSLPGILADAAAKIDSDYLAFLGDALASLPLPESTDRGSQLSRHRDKEVIFALLARFCRESPSAASAIDDRLGDLNRGIDALDVFLERQNFRLSFWKTAGEELMYRRFFDVNTLVGLRTETEQVFNDTHSLVLDWLHRGILDGVRIDHPDGLRDPEEYFQRLRKAAPDVWIVAEKILELGEPLRRSWPVAGTTGYDFLNKAGGLFVHPDGLAELTRFYESYTGETTGYEEMCHEKKHLVMRDILGSDVNRLVSLLALICENHRNHRDYVRSDMHRAIRQLVACFSVYRTYVVSNRGAIVDLDRHYIREAVEKAKDNPEEVDTELFDFIGDLLQLKYPGTLENEFVMRFQQFTGPAMAKGVEDTTFYCFNRLTSANEVGGDPGHPDISLEEFHSYNGQIQAEWADTMLATSTHDTKRSEDVRARIHLLTEIPERFSEAVSRWTEMNRQFKTRDYPDPNTEYLLYQTLIGAWPIDAERTKQYLQKATRESKRITSWINPNEEFDAARDKFIESILNHRDFVTELEQFVAPLIGPGRVSSLAQVLLKMTSPGIPDLYQGSELWDLSLVDPDNRRPVDYNLRRRLLAELPQVAPATIWTRQDEGLPKLWLIHRCLAIRKQYAASFSREGDYYPRSATGASAEHVITFGRGNNIIVAAPRFTIGLDKNWRDTALPLPTGVWNNQLTEQSFSGSAVSAQELFSQFPVALLAREN